MNNRELPFYVVRVTTAEGPQLKKVIIDEKGQKITEDIPGPLSAVLELTNRCNLECVCCLNNSGPSVDTSTELKLPEIYDIIDQLSAMGTTGITLSGGEPFLRREIFDIIEYARQKMFVSFSTNGLLLDKKTADNLCKEGIAGVIVDIHSCDAALNDAITKRKGSFKKAVQGVKNCLEAGVVCSINTTVTKMNMDTIEDTINFALELGVDMVINKFIPVGRGDVNREKLVLSLDEYRDVVTLLYEKKKALETTMDIQVCHIPYESLLLDQGIFTGCDAGLMLCKITPQGEVYTCPFLPISVGNIREQSFADIWRTSPSPVLKALRTRKGLKGKCATCEHTEKCGGCRANAYAYTDDFLESDPYCIIQ